ncbi:MAG: hypothetical protein MRJ65_15945 [Candidatus Brocadiaceae bacterium]|nr:hypothetical protein [Candidatus Brocadiaceae bacterium]
MDMEPDLLILDKPANDLDHRHRRRFITYLNGLDTAFIAASHDLLLIRELTNRCILMNKEKFLRTNLPEN